MMRVIFSPRRGFGTHPNIIVRSTFQGWPSFPQDTYFGLDGPGPGRQRSKLQAGQRVSYWASLREPTFNAPDDSRE